MVRYESLAPVEKHYFYIDALAKADYINGVFGTITNGVFTAGAGAYCVMQVEDGDDAHSDKFKVLAGQHVRVADMAKGEGYVINITADELPKTYAVDDVLVAGSDGMLTVGSGKGYKVIEVTDYGVRAVVALA